MTLDPIHQFNIDNLFTIGHIGGYTIYFTNSSAYMLLTVAVICLLAIGGLSRWQLVPGRFQSSAELSYEFVASMIRSNAGQEGMKFFPLVYSLFMFILVSNLIGIIPYTFTVAAQIIVTASFALLVFFTVLIYGFYKNGLKFFKIFVPSGIPIYILPLVVAIEILSFLSRPLSHSVRASVRQHAGRSHHAQGLRGFRRAARHLTRRNRLDRRCNAARNDGRNLRPRNVGRSPAGLRVCDPDLHLPQRRPSSGTLIGPEKS